MKRLSYIKPETAVVDVELRLMQAISGGGSDSIQVNPKEDDSSDDSRSRRGGMWSFDDEDDF